MLAALLLFACQPTEDLAPPVNPHAAQIEGLHTTFEDMLYKMAKNARYDLSPTAPPDTSLSKSLVSNVESDEVVPAPELVDEHTMLIQVPLTEQQIDLSDDFINQVWNAEGTDIYASIDAYENKIALSSLTEEEKFELLTIAESIRALAEFLENGGIDLVYEQVLASLPPGTVIPEGIVRGSCIEIKNIMQGAVYTGFVGMIAGTIVGCKVGMIVIPIAGTAHGCVGGAVFGFTRGFFGAALGSLGQQMIFDCLLKYGMKYDPETGDYIDTEAIRLALQAEFEKFKRQQQWNDIKNIVFVPR